MNAQKVICEFCGFHNEAVTVDSYHCIGCKRSLLYKIVEVDDLFEEKKKIKSGLTTLCKVIINAIRESTEKQASFTARGIWWKVAQESSYRAGIEFALSNLLIQLSEEDHKRVREEWEKIVL